VCNNVVIILVLIMILICNINVCNEVMKAILTMINNDINVCGNEMMMCNDMCNYY